MYSLQFEVSFDLNGDLRIVDPSSKHAMRTSAAAESKRSQIIWDAALPSVRIQPAQGNSPTGGSHSPLSPWVSGSFSVFDLYSYSTNDFCGTIDVKFAGTCMGERFDTCNNCTVTYNDPNGHIITGEFSETAYSKVYNAFFIQKSSGKVVASLSPKYVPASSSFSTPSLSRSTSPLSTPKFTPSISGFESPGSDLASFGLDAMPMWNEISLPGEYSNAKWFDPMSLSPKTLLSKKDESELFSQFLLDSLAAESEFKLEGDSKSDGHEDCMDIQSECTSESTCVYTFKNSDCCRDADTSSIFSADSSLDALYIPEGDDDVSILSVDQEWQNEWNQHQVCPLDILISSMLAVKIAANLRQSHAASTPPSLLSFIASPSLQNGFSEDSPKSRLPSSYNQHKSQRLGLGNHLHKPYGNLHHGSLARNLGPSHSRTEELFKRKTLLRPKVEKKWSGSSITIPLSQPPSPQQQQQLLAKLLQQPKANPQLHAAEFVKIVQAAQQARQIEMQAQQQMVVSQNLAARLAAKFSPCFQSDRLPGDLFF